MKDDGTYPNNEHYPTLIYKNAFHGSETDGRQLLLLNKNTVKNCVAAQWNES